MVSIVDRALKFAEDTAAAAGDLATGTLEVTTETRQQYADSIEAYVTEATGSPEAGAKAKQEFLDSVL